MSRICPLFLLPLIAMVSVVQGQTDSTRRWTIEAGAGAGLGYRTLSRIAPSSIADRLIGWRDEQEKPRMALGGHLGVGYQLSRCIGLEAGFGYTQLGWQQQIHMEGLTFGDMIDPRRGFIYSTNDLAMVERITFSEVYHYLDLRLGATFTLGQGRWRSLTSLGVAPALLVAARTRTQFEYREGRPTHENREAMGPYDDFNLFPYFSTGLAFHPGRRWEWRLQPVVRYGALRIIDAPITAHVFSGTVDFSVRYAL